MGGRAWNSPGFPANKLVAGYNLPASFLFGREAFPLVAYNTAGQADFFPISLLSKNNSPWRAVPESYGMLEALGDCKYKCSV